MPLSVAGIAFEDGKVFIARRKPGGDLGEKWEFPGGKVEEGEGDATALCREYLEEFGISISVGDHLASGEFTHRGRTFDLRAYRVSFDSRTFAMTEHTEWRWVSFDEINSLDFADSDRLLLPALEAYFNAQGGL